MERCAAAGVPEARREYRSKTELALEMLEQARARGYLKAQWVAGDSAFGMSPTLREGISRAGMQYVLDVRPDLTVWPLEPTWTKPLDQPALSGQRASPQTQVAAGGAADHGGSAARVTRQRKPGEVLLWAVYRQNMDGSEPRYYLSNAP